MQNSNSKILITGTGRAGTTFLMRLFTLLGLSTGFTPETMHKYIFENCNAGLEITDLRNGAKILKSPSFMTKIQELINRRFSIGLVIVPVRDFHDSAKSRVSHGKQNGGLMNATDLDSQIEYYKKAMGILTEDCKRNNIPILFIEFDKMVSDPEYLFNILKDIIGGISFETFNNEYIKASEMSRPKK